MSCHRKAERAADRPANALDRTSPASSAVRRSRCIVRLVLLSILIGVILEVLGLDPWNIIESLRTLIQRIWDMGFDAIALAVALSSCSAPSSCADLADHAADAHAEGTVTLALSRPPLMPGFPVTHARVFAIAGPAMLANLTTPLLGIVGTAAIGRLGEAHLLGGVAMAALVFDGIYWLFGFLRMGTVALTAQALGAGDAVEQRAVLSRALLIAAAHRRCC